MFEIAVLVLTNLASRGRIFQAFRLKREGVGVVMFSFWWWVSRGFRFGTSRVFPARNIPGRLGAMFFPLDSRGQQLHFIIIENLHTIAYGSTHQKSLCEIDCILFQSP